MKQEELYKNLKELAEKLGIYVKDENLKISGIKVRSGLCKIKGEQFFIMDKHKKVREKNEIIANCLNGLDLDSIYIVPAVREYLEGFK